MTEFETDDLVWAKMGSFPFWPGKISLPPGNMKTGEKPDHLCVYFYGTRNFAWIKTKSIVRHSAEALKQYSKKQKSKSFLLAVEELERGPSPDVELASENAMTTDEAETSDDEQPRPLMTFKGTSSKLAKRKKLGDEKSPRTPKVKKMAKQTEYESSFELDDLNESQSSVDSAYRQVALIRPYDGSPPSVQSGILTRRVFVERPPTPPFMIDEIHETFKNRGKCASEKKIGFLGLGHMGRIIARNFLNAGYDLTVWTRSHDICDDFVSAGAKKGLTPSDVVNSCDIIFCCVSDADAVQNVIFGTYGVLKGLKCDEEDFDPDTKAYVELSSIEPETSMRMKDAITTAGGRYLEAPISGDRTAAFEGSLIIIASGDEEVYKDCVPIFKVISKSATYIGPTVGDSLKMNLALSSLMGTANAALGEAMALISNSKMSSMSFVEILNESSFKSQWLTSKVKAMHSESFGTELALKHQQKDISLTLSIGDAVAQPLYVTASANELYIHAKRLRYSDHDVSAVYFGAKY